MLTVNREFLRLALATGIALLMALVAGTAGAQPTFSSLEPAANAVLASGTGTLTGQVSGADTLSINGDAVALSGGGFSYSFDLQEGAQVLQLVADGPGGQTAINHPLVIDTLAPAIAVTAPASDLVTASPLTVAGTAVDPHLQSVQVNGQAASVTDGAWSLSVALTEGPQTLTVRADDALGHVAVQSVAVTLDTAAPTVAILEGGAPFAGGLLNRAVAPTVSVSDGSGQVATTEIRLNGAAHTSGSAISTDGVYTLSATATDAAGWSTTASVDFTLDLQAPTLGSILPAVGTVLATPSATLSVDAPGATQVRVGSAVTPGGSPFSLAVPLAEGRNDLLVEALDDAGNRVERLHRLYRDTTAPALAVGTPSDGDVTSTALVRVAGTASDERLQDVSVNGAPANLVGTTFEALDVPLVAGANVLTVVATDSLGNQTTETLTVTLDDTAPTFTVSANGQALASGETFSSDVTLAISVDDPTATLTATLDGAAVTPPVVVTADGQHELSVTVTSVGGVSASALYVFTVDRQAPAFGAITPAAGHVQSGATLTLTGGLSGAVQLTVDGQPANLFGTDFSAGPFTVAAGERTFTLVATGANGLQTTVIHRVVRDVEPPVISIQRPADGALVGEASVDVSGSLVEAHPHRVTVSGVEASVSGSTFFAPGVSLAEGANTLTVVAEDAAGLTSELSRSVTYDGTAPELTVTDPTSGTTTPDARYTIRGTADDPHLDRVEVGGQAAPLEPSGAWSLEVPLSEGENALTARAFDRVGRSTEVAFSIFRDSEAPSVQITVPSDGASVAGAEIEVRGAVEDVPGTTVTVNGRDAFVDQGIFFVTVPLSEGESVLTARATDAQGNDGVHTRTVIRDETPPSFVGSDPVAGALAVPVGSSFRLEFSEALADPVGGALTLEAEGQALAVQIDRDGSALVVTPSSPLPSASNVTLTLTAQLTDLAGHALEPV
ncbi:MAG: Ig-like domain-containing protein, partial [Acidobacteriota bacterium]